MRQVGSALQFVGGRFGAVAASGLLIGAFTVLVGLTPGQFMANLLRNPPPWVLWVSPALVILGLAIIWASLRYNVWSQRQKAIDDLAEDISVAIRELTNVHHLETDKQRDDFDAAYQAWCSKVSRKLENRAFFTKADQLHFDRLGYIDPITMYAGDRVDHIHSQLKLKFERLRDVINWSQQRRH